MIIIFTISEDGEKVICRIYDKYHKLMLRTAVDILGSARSEDAVHDVFVKMLERFENNIEDLGDKPRQFFVISVRNHALNLMNKEKLRFIELDGDMADDDNIFQSPQTPEDILLQQDSFERLVAIIRKLKPNIRQILENKYILGYTNKEIAEMMGISQSAVSTRIDKAKKKLRTMYLEMETQK